MTEAQKQAQRDQNVRQATEHLRAIRKEVLQNKNEIAETREYERYCIDERLDVCAVHTKLMTLIQNRSILKERLEKAELDLDSCDVLDQDVDNLINYV